MPLSEDVVEKYQPTIGIETHVQLKTKTKLFSGVSNDARQAAPNSLISHIDTGMPGALPVLNEKALELSARVAFALNTEPQKFSKFDRKHYFYPDLPKGYQITQYENPLIVGGMVEIKTESGLKKVNITRVHLEEDAGKNIHPAGADYSLVDLNRAGTPLLEIVSEPDINSAAEAKAYARELYLLMKYAGVSDVDLYHGNMRFDVNISVSSDPTKLGKRTEVKNLNSFRSVENAVAYEINRQIELLEKNEPVTQETRGWDEAKQKTTAQRGKEEAHDYRYMPEPDIPPVELDDAYIEDIKNSMPMLPPEIRRILDKSSISEKVIEDILDRERACEHIIQQVKQGSAQSVKRLAFWLLQAEPLPDDQPGHAEHELSIDAAMVDKLSKMVELGKLNSNAAQTVFNEMIMTSQDPEQVAKAKNLIQLSDEGELEKIVAEVISANPDAAADIKSGEAKAIGYLVGQVMAKSQGTANPQVTQTLIKKQLGL